MKKLLSFLKYLFLLGMSAFLMWYALKELDFQKMWSELQNTNYTWVGASLLMGVAAYVSRAYRWHMQIKPTGYKPSLLHTYRAMMVGYLANLVLPRMGEVVRCSMLKRTDSVPIHTGFGTVIAERFIDLVMLLVAVGLTFLVEFNRIRDFFLNLFSDKYTGLEQTMNSLYWVFWVLLGSMAVALFIVLRNLKRLRENLYFQKAVGFIKGMLQSITTVGSSQLFYPKVIFVRTQ